MGRRLILDTGVLIAAERGALALQAVVVADDDIVMAAVTLAEFRTGIELANDRVRDRRAAYLDGLLARVPVEPYDSTVAAAHARLLAFVHRSGSRPGAHDLIVAATAVATGRVLVSTDRAARFEDLPGLESLLID